MDKVCQHCGALHWTAEKSANVPASVLSRESCCKHGAVKVDVLRDPPQLLKDLFTGNHELSTHFLKNIRQFNLAFAFTSVGCNTVSATGRSCSCPSSFMIHGKLYHLQGPINHIRNSEVSENRNAVPSYAQLYIYDPAFGASNRVENNLDPNVNLIEQLTNMLHTDNVNPFVNIYKHAHVILKDEYERQASNEEESTPFHTRLSPQMTMELVTGNDRRTENLPTTSEITAVIPTEFAGSSFRDIKITYRNGVEHDNVYNGLTDALSHDNSDLRTVGTKFILPSSYTRGPRFMAKMYQDSMAIVRHFGDDSIFRDPEKIDEVICAELPSDDDPELLDLVSGQMMHGPCGNINPKCPCMVSDAYGVLKCSKSFPKPFQPTTAVMPNSYPLYRRRLDGRSHRVQIKDNETNGMMSVYLTNQHVVPYNLFLTKKHKAHINVELCGSIDAIKYINKYVYKGPDRTTVHLKNENDEIERYLTSRYIGPTEAVRRLFEYAMHEEDPSVTSLAIHLENEQPVYFDPESSAEEIQQTLDNTHLTLMDFSNTT
ncbi:hypothetical protein G6F48_011789 [Rhizopus delemar]|nr:hypothetical protein G6F48_011789 [Rhizopus delemar]